MRKFPYIVFIAFCMIALHAKGQSSVGIKTDMNLSDFLVNDTSHLKSSMRASVSAGFFYKYTWDDNAGLQADMLFRYRTSEIKNLTTGETGDYRYCGIELPVYHILQIDVKQNLLYIGMGSFASFGLFSRYETGTRSTDLYKKDPTSGKTMLYHWNFGTDFILGYELECKLQFNFNFQLGLRNLFDKSFGNVWMNSLLISLGAGYRF